MEFWNHLSERSKIVLIGILAVIFAFAGVHFIPGAPSNPTGMIILSDPPTHLTVYVTGAVRHPGVYTLHNGTRVQDAILIAGGASKDWDPIGINLAKRLEDEEMVVVPKIGAEKPANFVQKTKTTEPVNLNRAGVMDLQKLPGVGPGMAKRIFDYRASHGAFKSVEGLRSVPGVGEKKFQRMKPFLQL